MHQHTGVLTRAKLWTDDIYYAKVCAAKAGDVTAEPKVMAVNSGVNLAFIMPSFYIFKGGVAGGKYIPCDDVATKVRTVIARSHCRRFESLHAAVAGSSRGSHCRFCATIVAHVRSSSADAATTPVQPARHP